MILREAVAVGVLIAILFGYILGYGVVAGEKYPGQGAHLYQDCPGRAACSDK